jgi:hypothetical protein
VREQDSQIHSVVTDTTEQIKEINMKIAVWYNKNKPTIDLVYATTHKTDVELEKIIIDVEEGQNLLEQVHEHLGIEYVEPQSDCGLEGC